MGRKRNLGMHAEAANLPAPAIAYRELAKLWLRKAFGAGTTYRLYKQAGTEVVDAAFMDASNEGVNHIYGFEGFVPPSIAFNKYVDAYVWCCGMNASTTNNPPFDTVQPLRESAEWRKKFVPKGKTGEVLEEGMDAREAKLLAALVGELTSEKRERTESDRIATIDFVVAEIEPRLYAIMAHLDKDRGFATEDFGESFVDAEGLDDALTREDQELLLGECRREGDKVAREGMRGAYATATANLKRAMFNAEMERELSGVFWDTRESWTYLMRINRTNIINPKPPSKEDTS